MPTYHMSGVPSEIHMYRQKILKNSDELWCNTVVLKQPNSLLKTYHKLRKKMTFFSKMLKATV